MSKCPIDHTQDEVRQKYEEQKEFLPENITALFQSFFSKEHEQEVLNEAFHLLKKYDLADKTEQARRDGLIIELLN